MRECSNNYAWTEDEDRMLKVIVLEYRAKDWNDIAAAYNAMNIGRKRHPYTCRCRWVNVVRPARYREMYRMNK